MTQTLFIKDIMSRPVTIAKSAVITEALDRMLDQGIDPLIVTNNGTVIGTVSRRSIAEVMGSKRNANVSPNQIHVANVVEEEFTSAYADEGIDIVVPLLQVYKLVVVLDGDHRPIGQVSRGDLLRVLRPQGSVDQVMEKVAIVSPDERVVHLRRRMLDDGANRYVVANGAEFLGMVTETDVARAMAEFREDVADRFQDHRVRNLIVSDIMSTPLISVPPETLAADLVETMLTRGISAVPVVENGRVLGAVSRQSLVRAL
ncbi:MAG TPA: CBS domain-containing protein [Methanoregulaceae archaeon]|nr:CBS domain-containing protein [Methanoregulaceae archaeon]HQJ88564.1 CBS domain-containing protein [Methanoregulaceae archaeon]